MKFVMKGEYYVTNKICMSISWKERFSWCDIKIKKNQNDRIGSIKIGICGNPNSSNSIHEKV